MPQVEQKELFRKAALARLSSPEELDQLMQVTTPKGWLALLGLVGLILVALMWGVLGHIPTIAQGQGVLLKQEGSTGLEALIYLPAPDGQKVRPDMPVQITPASTDRADVGFISGRVVSVSQLPMTQQDLIQTLGNQGLAQYFSANGPVIEIRAELIEDPNSFSGYHWSTGDPQVTLDNGTMTTMQIVTNQQHPLSFVIPQLENIMTGSWFE
jgi:hypothetical protein